MARRLVVLAIALIVWLPTWLFAQQDDVMSSGRRVLTAERMGDGERVTLDGVLDEPQWKRAGSAGELIMQDPVLGGKPSESTDIRVVFNTDHLYIGVVCHDSEPDKLLGNTRKRDEFLSADDRFMWTMDTFLNQQTGYFFEMNPSGLMADSLMGPGGNHSREWDGIWNARVRRSEIGWTIEIDIPFRTLAFDPNAPAWGINFQRTVRRKNEESVWTGHLRNQGLRRMSNAGLLVGLEDVTQGRGLEVEPAVRSRVSRGGARASACGSERPRRRCRWRGDLQPHAKSSIGRNHQHGLCRDRGGYATGEPDAISPLLSRKARLLPRRRFRQLPNDRMTDLATVE